jgi:hypothetical protein
MASLKPWHSVVTPREDVRDNRPLDAFEKVLTRLASSGDLRLEVSFELPVDRDHAQSRAGEARSGPNEPLARAVSPWDNVSRLPGRCRARAPPGRTASHLGPGP